MSKFLHDKPTSAWCAECGKPLTSRGLVRNRNHLYGIGVLYACPCRKGAIWTNSVRNERRLLAFFDGKKDELFGRAAYTNGFCNDLFDGVDGEMDYVKVLKNGYRLNGRSLDLIGNDHTKVVVDFRSFLPESNSSEDLLIDFYRQHEDELRELSSATSKAPMRRNARREDYLGQTATVEDDDGNVLATFRSCALLDSSSGTAGESNMRVVVARVNEDELPRTRLHSRTWDSLTDRFRRFQEVSEARLREVAAATLVLEFSETGGSWQKVWLNKSWAETDGILRALADYPLLDDAEHTQLETEYFDEAMENGHREMLRALPEMKWLDAIFDSEASMSDANRWRADFNDAGPDDLMEQIPSLRGRGRERPLADWLDIIVTNRARDRDLYVFEGDGLLVHWFGAWRSILEEEDGFFEALADDFEWFAINELRRLASEAKWSDDARSCLSDFLELIEGSFIPDMCTDEIEHTSRATSGDLYALVLLWEWRKLHQGNAGAVEEALRKVAEIIEPLAPIASDWLKDARL